MRTFSGFVVSCMLAGSLGSACSVTPDGGDGTDSADGPHPIPRVAVMIDGIRYERAEVPAAVTGRTLHYVASSSDELHAFDSEDEAMAFAKATAAAAPHSMLTLPIPTFFEHDNFGGCWFSSHIDLSELFTVGFCRQGWNDVISSVDTQGYLVRLREHVDFAGSTLTLFGRYPSLRPFGWNDMTSSIDIQ